MSDARTIYREGFDHFVNDRLADAIDAYRKALAADPDLAIAWNALAIALERSGEIDGAIDAAKRLIELEPDEPLSHTSLSRLYQQKGMIPEAEDEQALASRLTTRQQGS